MSPAAAVTVSHRCNACGKCCNSPPLLSLPELLRHQDLFVGCLSLRRGAGRRLAVLGQAYDYPSLHRCPALGPDRRCTLHERGKPAVCAVVPLDAALPDSMQAAVLLGRNASASYFGAQCIVAGESAQHEVIVRGGRLVDAGSIEALERRREAVRLDEYWWGNALSEQLAREPPAIPAGGYLSLSIAPVLNLAARVSAACRRRCLDYIERQLALIEGVLDQAVLRQRGEDLAASRELRTFAEAHRRLSRQLGPGAAAPALDAARRREFERYLGVA